MTNRARPILLGSLLVLLAASCASDSSGTADAPASRPDAMPDAGSVIATGTLRADIDGAEWVATTAGASFSQGVLGIGGQDNAGRIIAIGVDATVPGTYTVDGNDANCTLTEGTDVWIALGPLGSGSVTLTALTSTSATGTFQFVAAHASGGGADKIIANGSFDLTFGGAN